MGKWVFNNVYELGVDKESLFHMLIFYTISMTLQEFIIKIVSNLANSDWKLVYLI